MRKHPAQVLIAVQLQNKTAQGLEFGEPVFHLIWEGTPVREIMQVMADQMQCKVRWTRPDGVCSKEKISSYNGHYADPRGFARRALQAEKGSENIGRMYEGNEYDEEGKPIK